MKRIKKFLPLVLILAPIIGFVLFFIIAAILMESAGTFSVEEKTSGQKVLQTFADTSAVIAWLCFTYLIPAGFIAGILVFVRRRSQSKKQQTSKE